MKQKILIFIFGGLFMSLMAQWSIKLPITHVKISLQSLSVSLMTIFFMQNARWGVASYLLMATLGWPVLAGGEINSTWYLTSKAGYYVGFFMASIIVSHVLRKFKPANWMKSWLCLSVNEMTILTTGWIVLSVYTTPIRAWEIGIYPFLLGAFIKISLATLIWMAFQKRQPCQSVIQ